MAAEVGTTQFCLDELWDCKFYLKKNKSSIRLQIYFYFPTRIMYLFILYITVNLTWYSTEPDFTKCFHSTVLVYLPCAWIWFLLPFYHFWCKYTVQTPSLKKWAKITVTRLAMVTLLCVLSVAQLGVKINEYAISGVTPVSEVVAPAITCSGI